MSTSLTDRRSTERQRPIDNVTTCTRVRRPIMRVWDVCVVNESHRRQPTIQASYHSYERAIARPSYALAINLAICRASRPEAPEAIWKWGARAVFPARSAGKFFYGALPLLSGAPFDRGHQTKVWGTQRFDRYSSDCEWRKKNLGLSQITQQKTTYM